MSVDSIGDFLTIIRNGIMISKPFVLAPYSKMRWQIAQILKDEGFITNAEVVNAEDPVQKKIKVFLKYVGNESVIHEIKRVSKPGRRYYSGVEDIEPVIGGLGLSVLTTNRGIISHKKAKEFGVGGEIMFTVW
ncbi:MAG TPA: 30S ribosomal protein S8 [Mariniflexile sp.]